MTDTLDNEWDFASGVRKAPRSGQRRNGLELLTRENFCQCTVTPTTPAYSGFSPRQAS
jgi:hypothetical protein